MWWACFVVVVVLVQTLVLQPNLCNLLFIQVTFLRRFIKARHSPLLLKMGHLSLYI